MQAFVRAYPPAQPAAGAALWFLFHQGELLLLRQESEVGLPLGVTALLPIERPLFLGTLGGVACIAGELSATDALPEELALVGLRALFGRINDDQYAVAGYATQMLNWQATSRFCPCCGSPTEAVEGEWARRCSSCGQLRYPPVSPCVIVLIHDGERVLLSHKAGWGPMHSIIAGFVEPGESLEECLVREVREEVGVEIDQIRYFGSQPWPYPHQLMVGFFARYAGGEVTPDPTELDFAGWFHVSELPTLPFRISIARQMLDAWAAEVRR